MKLNLIMFNLYYNEIRAQNKIFQKTDEAELLIRLGWPWDRDGSSHPTKALSRPGPGPGLAWDRELPSHRDLVPSHPMKKNFLPSRSRGTPGWDRDGTGHPVPCQEMLLFYNIHTN